MCQLSSLASQHLWLLSSSLHMSMIRREERTREGSGGWILTATIPVFSFCFLRFNPTEYSPGKSRSLLCLPLSSAAVSCMLLPKYLLLPGDKDRFSSILGRARGKNCQGKPLLLKHTHHLYSDSLWQRVLLSLHPVSPHTSR